MDQVYQLALQFGQGKLTEFGIKKVIRSWWSQLPNAMHPWAVFTSAGLIDEDRAEKWCRDIYGSRDKYLDYC